MFDTTGPQYTPYGGIGTKDGDWTYTASGWKKNTASSVNQPYTEQQYSEAVVNHPIIQQYTAKGNTASDLEYASSTGDFSGLVNQFGMPFSIEDQQAAMKQAEDDNKLYYEALQSKDKADTEAQLAQKQADYQNYLLTSGQQFQEDKGKLDQTAADQGVLFSGMRKQKEQNLQKQYEQEQNYKLGSYGRDIGQTARDYQYAYGNDSANSLNKYYKLGGNTYNPNVATGGVGSSGLSNIYRTGNYNFQGTTNVERKAQANKRAAGYLWNRGNKLLATGSGNQY
jgi:hypothetical protein